MGGESCTLLRLRLMQKLAMSRIGSKVTAILLNGLILPTGGVASGRVCPAAYAACLFLYLNVLYYVFLCIIFKASALWKIQKKAAK